MATKKRSAEGQHYVPQLYLKGFMEKRGCLWVYEQFRPPRISSPQEEAQRPDYYTFEREDGQREDAAEDLLAEIESRVAEPLRKLANPQYKLSNENAEALKVFVAFMFARVPSWRNNLNRMAVEIATNNNIKHASDKEKFYDICKKVEVENGAPFGVDYEKLRQDFLTGRIQLEMAPSYSVGAMVHSAEKVVDLLFEFGLQVLYAPPGFTFVTSDAPVFTVLPDRDSPQATIGMGFAWPGVEVYFPLNKRACLRLRRGLPQGQGTASEKLMNMVRRVTMATAERYLYASEGRRRIARLFDQHGCKIRPGKESFLTTAEKRQERFL